MFIVHSYLHVIMKNIFDFSNVFLIFLKLIIVRNDSVDENEGCLYSLKSIEKFFSKIKFMVDARVLTEREFLCRLFFLSVFGRIFIWMILFKDECFSILDCIVFTNCHCCKWIVSRVDRCIYGFNNL